VSADGAVVSGAGISPNYASEAWLAVYKPIIRSLNPTSRSAGGSAFTLVVTGIGFAQGSTVYWNGTPRSTTFVSANRLEASMPSSDLATTADITTIAITVVGPTGSTSNPKAFTILGSQGNVAAVDSSVAVPGQPVTVSTAPTTAGQIGVSATLNNTGGDPVSVTVANYSSNPSGTAFSAGGGFTDVQITGADPADTATVNFYYPSAIDPATKWP
jgi:hypothetical protein